MWDTNKVQEARMVAEMAHGDTTRWDGKTPYITHPIAVANKMVTSDQKQVALLHDVLEDTALTMEDLIHHGFSKVVRDAVAAITKGQAERYVDYLDRVAENVLAATVKIADIEHNIGSLPPKNKQRRQKYELAIAYLKLKLDRQNDE